MDALAPPLVIYEPRPFTRSDGAGLTYFQPRDGSKGFYRTVITLQAPDGTPIAQRQLTIEAPSPEAAFAELDRQRDEQAADLRQKAHAAMMNQALQKPITPIEERRLRFNGRRRR